MKIYTLSNIIDENLYYKYLRKTSKIVLIYLVLKLLFEISFCYSVYKFKQEFINSSDVYFEIDGGKESYSKEEKEEIVKLLTDFSYNESKFIGITNYKSCPVIFIKTKNYEMKVYSYTNYKFQLYFKNGWNLGDEKISYNSLLKLYEKYSNNYDSYSNYIKIKNLLDKKGR